MVDKNLIVLDYPFSRSAVVNDFLNETGLHKYFYLVLAEVEYIKNDESFVVRRRERKVTSQSTDTSHPGWFTRLALEPVDEKLEFYWSIKGHESIKGDLNDYINSRHGNRGIS